MKKYFFLTILVLGSLTVFGQSLDMTVLDQLEFREIGPWRGGRSTAVVGHPVKKDTYYFGATGGGVWKSDDAGQNWENISDGFFGGSIGSIVLAPSRPLTIYVGGGENSLRGNVSSGWGVWKSDDGGRTWQEKGLKDSRHIMRMVVHPENPDVVYAAALGHLYGPNAQRGVFKSIDGGDTWKKVLYLNDSVGACDLVMDPVDPDILLATFWNVKRTPYSLESGGPGSGMWKSTDGGETWKEITGNKGLPEGNIGIIGVSISPANPDRYYAIVEAEQGGVFTSEDAGVNWTRVNAESDLRQRAWYYSKIFCDPKDEDIVYVLNVQFWKSEDGGKKFTSIRTPHGDHHDLWIDREDPMRMIIGDDGGAQVSTNGGARWSTYYNQPTAQIYRVSTDNHVPYRILGAQQDNTSLRIFHRSKGGSIGRDDWEPTAGFESGYIVAHPDNPELVYGGNYSGFIGCLNHLNGDRRNITVWPNDPIGQGADRQKYRFQWNFPLFFSPHHSNRLYAAGNVLFYTDDNGDTWIPVSGDLTTNDKSKQQPSGGIITKDNTGVEVYCTIFAAAESPHEAGVLLAGSDDGLLHITKDNGGSWENITPPDLPAWTQINSVEFDPFDPDRIYFAGTRYKSDDYTPYLYTSGDYGRSWQRIDKGIDRQHFTRVLRADPETKGLLYCGTEYGLYVSVNAGTTWAKWKANLPEVPVTDMTIKENDLIIATQGRGFWVLDDLSVVQGRKMQKGQLTVYKPKPTWLIRGWKYDEPQQAGMNPPPGAVIRYNIGEKVSMPLSIVVIDHRDSVVKTFTENGKDSIEVEQGLNEFAWDLRYPASPSADGMFLWNGAPSGPKAAPGDYLARFIHGSDTIDMPFTVKKDPGSTASDEDLMAQFLFLTEVQDLYNRTHSSLSAIKEVRKQVNQYKSRLDSTEHQAIIAFADSLTDSLTTIENILYETRNKSSQDMLNYGIKLNDKLAGVYNAAAYGNFKPGEQVKKVFAELSAEISIQLDNLDALTTDGVDTLNQMIHQAMIPAITLPEVK